MALTLWTLWLVGTAGYFSVARFYHVYYLIMLGPGVAALAGIGIAACWREYRQGWRQVWRREAYVLRESRVKTTIPEMDLFAGIV